VSVLRQTIINGRAYVTSELPPTWYAPRGMTSRDSAWSVLGHWLAYFELWRRGSLFLTQGGF
jgi:hypothetical protein